MMNFTMQTLNCTKFSMPRTDDMDVCDIKFSETYRMIMDNWPESYYLYFFKFHKLQDFPCNCLEPCSKIKHSITYMKAMSIRRYIIKTFIIIF